MLLSTEALAPSLGLMFYYLQMLIDQLPEFVLVFLEQGSTLNWQFIPQVSFSLSEPFHCRFVDFHRGLNESDSKPASVSSGSSSK